ncbi:MAG: hypothetical protein HQL56_12145 [Magnetococcales bacterium]|nr:hypothetical protein [Magnetococcales bacterium]
MAHGHPRLFVAGIVLLTGLGVYGWRHYQQAHAVVKVRVVNTTTQEVTLFEAPRNSVFRRTFHTVDGRLVTLSDVERMEIEYPE